MMFVHKIGIPGYILKINLESTLFGVHLTNCFFNVNKLKTALKCRKRPFVSNKVGMDQKMEVLGICFTVLLFSYTDAL